jgi:sigma-B regulation protein RsbU (phosphoserine phosphatase)
MLSYASAGHIAACLFDCEGNLKTNLSRTGPALGLVNSTQYETSPDIQLASGDLLLLLTDGAEEATNAGGQTYGRERIHSFIKAHRNENAASIVEGLYQDVRQFLGDAPQEDDVTLVVLKVN